MARSHGLIPVAGSLGKSVDQLLTEYDRWCRQHASSLSPDAGRMSLCAPHRSGGHRSGIEPTRLESRSGRGGSSGSEAAAQERRRVLRRDASPGLAGKRLKLGAAKSPRKTKLESCRRGCSALGCGLRRSVRSARLGSRGDLGRGLRSRLGCRGDLGRSLGSRGDLGRSLRSRFDLRRGLRGRLGCRGDLRRATGPPGEPGRPSTGIRGRLRSRGDLRRGLGAGAILTGAGALGSRGDLRRGLRSRGDLRRS